MYHYIRGSTESNSVAGILSRRPNSNPDREPLPIQSIVLTLLLVKTFGPAAKNVPKSHKCYQEAIKIDRESCSDHKM